MKATGNDDDSHGSIQDMERRFRAEEQQPYTVVVGYIGDDEGCAGQTWSLTPTATDPHMAGVVAIDDIILNAGMCEEDDIDELDRLRVDYKCLAIYAGHLTNLVQ